MADSGLGNLDFPSPILDTGSWGDDEVAKPGQAYHKQHLNINGVIKTVLVPVAVGAPSLSPSPHPTAPPGPSGNKKTTGSTSHDAISLDDDDDDGGGLCIVETAANAPGSVGATQPMTIAPSTQPMAIVPSTQPMNIASTAQPMNIAPTAQPMNIAPTAQPMNIAPTAQPMNIAPSTQPGIITQASPIAPAPLPAPIIPAGPVSYAGVTHAQHMVNSSELQKVRVIFNGIRSPRQPRPRQHLGVPPPSVVRLQPRSNIVPPQPADRVRVPTSMPAPTQAYLVRMPNGNVMFGYPGAQQTINNPNIVSVASTGASLQSQPPPYSNVQAHLPPSLANVQVHQPQEQSNVQVQLPPALANVQLRLPQAQSNVQVQLPPSLANVQLRLPQAQSNVQVQLPSQQTNVQVQLPPAQTNVQVQAPQTIRVPPPTNAVMQPNLQTQMLNCGGTSASAAGKLSGFRNFMVVNSSTMQVVGHATQQANKAGTFQVQMAGGKATTLQATGLVGQSTAGKPSVLPATASIPAQVPNINVHNPVIVAQASAPFPAPAPVQSNVIMSPHGQLTRLYLSPPHNSVVNAGVIAQQQQVPAPVSAVALGGSTGISVHPGPPLVLQRLVTGNALPGEPVLTGNSNKPVPPPGAGPVSILSRPPPPLVRGGCVPIQKVIPMTASSGATTISSPVTPSVSAILARDKVTEEGKHDARSPKAGSLRAILPKIPGFSPPPQSSAGPVKEEPKGSTGVVDSKCERSIKRDGLKRCKADRNSDGLRRKQSKDALGMKKRSRVIRSDTDADDDESDCTFPAGESDSNGDHTEGYEHDAELYESPRKSRKRRRRKLHERDGRSRHRGSDVGRLSERSRRLLASCKPCAVECVNFDFNKRFVEVNLKMVARVVLGFFPSHLAEDFSLMECKTCSHQVKQCWSCIPFKYHGRQLEIIQGRGGHVPSPKKKKHKAVRRFGKLSIPLE